MKRFDKTSSKVELEKVEHPAADIFIDLTGDDEGCGNDGEDDDGSDYKDDTEDEEDDNANDE